MPNKANVHAERLADCPFSVAQQYAEEHLRGAEHGGDSSVVYAGPLHRQVVFSFGTRSDTDEGGRPHDEITLRWSAGTKWLPNFTGTLRMRIASPGTLLVLDGHYVPPGGAPGVFFDRLLGNLIARITAGALLSGIARTLTERERVWREKTNDITS